MCRLAWAALPHEVLLARIYASRALLVGIYVVMPKTALNVYLFAGVLGFTWLATVPPTSGLVASCSARDISQRCSG